MKLNKFKIFLLLIVSIISIFGITSYNSQKYSSSVNINDSNIKDNNMLSMMLETSAGSGEYKETTATSWPTDGYEFNETLSRCKNGSKLSYDEDKNQVIFDGNTKDDCYVYFDKEKILLSNYITSQYTGTQVNNNLYYHNNSLENSAGDNSYRYAGSSETTNNFVCFGYDSTDGTCPTDNLYRIIGVFDNQIKLIKYDYANSNLLGTDGNYTSYTYSKSNYSTYKGELTTINRYNWHPSSSHTWSESELNTVNLNINYLNNIGNKWSSKIAMHTWQVGGSSSANTLSVAVAKTYKNEIVSPKESVTYDAKIGLMYVSDYGYAAAPSAWTTTLRTYGDSSVTSVNWMYMGLKDWAITLIIEYGGRVFNVNNNGNFEYNYVYQNFVVRPVFYLSSDVYFVSGSGTKASPYIIN